MPKSLLGPSSNIKNDKYQYGYANGRVGYTHIFNDILDSDCDISSDFVWFCRFIKFPFKFVVSVIVMVMRIVIFSITWNRYVPREENLIALITVLLFIMMIVISSIRSAADYDSSKSDEEKNTLRSASIVLYVFLMLFSVGMMQDDGVEKDNIVDFISFLVIGIGLGVVLFTDIVGMKELPIVAGILFAVLVFHYFKKNAQKIRSGNNITFDMVDKRSKNLYDWAVIGYKDNLKELDLETRDRVMNRAEQLREQVKDRRYKNPKRMYDMLTQVKLDAEELMRRGIELESLETTSSFSKIGKNNE